MRQRCANPNAREWPCYGGRGITVCARWRDSFENFLADMGRRPSPAHSLDRYPDNDGNYEPGNCRWATRREQALNRRPCSEEAKRNHSLGAIRMWQRRREVAGEGEDR